MKRIVLSCACLFMFLYTEIIQAAGQLEENTKLHAVQVYILHEQISGIAKMCEEPATGSKKLLQKGLRLIEEKTKTRLVDFAAMVRDETNQIKQLNSQLDAYDCMFYDNKVVLDAFLEDYDLAVYRLEISTPLNERLISQKEWDAGHDRRIKEAIDKFYDDAYVVAVGMVMNRSAVPSRAMQDSLYSTNKYWYRFDKGWKGAITEYMPEVNDYLYSDQDEALSQKSYDVLFFVDQYNTILEMIELKDEEMVMKQLDEPTWRYENGKLIR